MEKAGLEKSRYARRFGGIPISRLIGNSGQPRAKVAVAALALTTAAISVLAAALIFPSASRADDGDELKTFDGGEFKTFTVDVAQNPTTNAQNDVDPSEGQILFTRGDTFIVDGTIYPAGTIASGIADPDPNAPVIGKYRIRGTALGNSADFNRAIAGDPGAPGLSSSRPRHFRFRTMKQLSSPTVSGRMHACLRIV